MIGNSNFGFSGGGGSTPPPPSNGWLLDGNTNGALKYFGTNDNFGIPIYTNGSQIGVFTETGDFGFGISVPTARGHFQGSDATSSNFGLKVDNSASAPLLYARNDSTIIINSSTVPVSTNFYVKGNSGQDIALFGNNANLKVFEINNNRTIAINGNADTGTDIVFDINNPSGFTVPLRVRKSDSTALFAVFEAGYTNTNANALIGGYFVSPTARLQVIGVDSTSGAYALKVDNSSSSPLLYVRNDKFVGIGISAPTTSGGLFQVSQSSYDEVARFEGFFGGTLNAFVIDKNGNTISYQYSNVKEGFVLGSASFLSHFITAPNDWVLELGNTTLKNDSVNSKTVYQSGYNKLAFRNAGGSQMALLTGASDIMLFGVGLSLTPTATIHALGSDSTSSNFSLKIDNSSSAPLLYVRNDSVVSINASSITAILNIRGVDDSTSNYVLRTENSSSAFLLRQNNEGTLFLNNSAGNFTDILFHTTGTQVGKIRFFTGRSEHVSDRTSFRTESGGTIMVDINLFGNNETNILYKLAVQDGNGTFNPTATIHGMGADSTSSNYALKLDNSSSSPLLYVRNDSGVVIGSSSISARFHVVGLTNSINQRLEPVTNVTEDTSGGTVNTTDATANVTAQTIAVPTNKVISLESTIVYRKTGGAGVGTTGDGTTIKLNSSVKNVSGTLTLDTVQNTYTGTTNAIAGVSATYTISGTNVLVSVTGVINDDITWNVITKVNTVA